MTDLAVEEFAIQVGDRRVQAEWRRGGYRQSVVGELEIDDLRRRTVEVFVDLLRSNRLINVHELKLLGEHLFVTLFGSRRDDNGPGALLRRAIKGDPYADNGQRRLLRVVLEMGAGAELLASWPWEYLYVPLDREDPDTGFFLGESTNFMLTRKLPLAVSARMIQVRPPLRVLFVVLAPDDVTETDIEYEAVLETLMDLRDLGGEARIDLRVLTQRHAHDGRAFPPNEDLPVQTTWRSFLNTVEQFDPQVVHVISHGRYIDGADGRPRGQMAFPDENNKALWIDDRDLANQLSLSASGLRLVFLQACESAATSASGYHVISGLAQSLAQKNIPAVIAMHYQVQLRLANQFARAFYQALVDRRPIEVAMHHARRELYLSGMMGESQQRAGFGLPVLYLRESGPLLTPALVPVSASAGGSGPRVAEPSGPPGESPGSQQGTAPSWEQPGRPVVDNFPGSGRWSTGEQSLA
ncbi:CHAT domain-containing protein [Hamadaea sp. NPDC050747]|uniref:CHAT domain-containing protein n=1 Tax=Hamadaea sp. NPDC050747 TaxID=3155789 RepID=UPI0033C5264A